MAQLTRKEHLQWAKDRALAYVERGDVPNAYASLLSDLGKHPELASHIGILLGTTLLMGGQLNTAHQMREFINGLN